MPRLAQAASIQPHRIAECFFARRATPPRGRESHCTATTWVRGRGCLPAREPRAVNAYVTTPARALLTNLQEPRGIFLLVQLSLRLNPIAFSTSLSLHRESTVQPPSAARPVPCSNATVTGHSELPQAHQAARP
jgi:hypothetical protein